ncbi:hypothetical protein F4803DRAFT_564464 [Xylaria telfairii]|nr:hypothetical protein F4803DRAFT_564464 [Xylaria telfairii]
MDDYLVAVGRWTDDRALNQSAATRPRREENKSQHLHPAAEPHLRKSRANKADYAGSDWGNYRSRLSKSEDELLDTHPQNAIREVRASQMIQRQHPACFVNAEGGQQGNEATAAKPSGSLSRVGGHFLEQASIYLPLDEHEVKFPERGDEARETC